MTKPKAPTKTPDAPKEDSADLAALRAELAELKASISSTKAAPKPATLPNGMPLGYRVYTPGSSDDPKVKGK